MLRGLALRPEFRLKARSPSIEPPGTGDDKSRGKQSSSCRASRAACPLGATSLLKTLRNDQAVERDRPEGWVELARLRHPGRRDHIDRLGRATGVDAADRRTAARRTQAE